eukprot:TRINITY_DN7550_c0_g1_i2.p1 TRINITY_DN7550_c0_g1~~TRINITY_DN7550_c0_g1_i2.p1  ORF type:complete len:220 (+),score=24.15 TRINITY_DN7550_c0_g1_i2:30-662(+)
MDIIGRKALVVIDVQNDFYIGGSLAIANSNEIINPINKLLNSAYFDLIVFSQDCHPKNHVSFASTHNMKSGDVIDINGKKQELWPDHCVIDTEGYKIVPYIELPRAYHTVYKGTNKNIDSYSAFENLKESQLNQLLIEKEIKNVFCCGLATDFCVKATCYDSSSLGYNTFIIRDGVKGCMRQVDQLSSEFNTNNVSVLNSMDILKGQHSI